MFGLPALGGKGGASNFNVDPSVTEAIAKKPRAVLITLDGETLTASSVLEPCENMESDFEALRKLLTDACIVLFRDDDEQQWNLLSWIPSGTGVKKRTMYASSHGQIKKLLPSSAGCREYAMVDAEDATYEAYKAHVRVATSEERLAAMTLEERVRLEVDEEIAKERSAQPSRLAGLAAVEAPIASSWKTKLASMSKNDYSIVTYKNSELDGVFESGLEKLSALKGTLAELPAYVVWKVDEKKVIVVLWSPDNTSKEVRVLKMSLTSYKSDFVSQIKEVCGDTVSSAEAHDDDDLECFEPMKVFETAPENDRVTASKKKPPLGGVAMPGFGGVKMPGM